MPVRVVRKRARSQYPPPIATCRGVWEKVMHTWQTLTLSRLPPFRGSSAAPKTYPLCRTPSEFRIGRKFSLYKRMPPVHKLNVLRRREARRTVQGGTRMNPMTKTEGFELEVQIEELEAKIAPNVDGGETVLPLQFLGKR